MIEYDVGSWGILFIFKLKGSVFPKAMMWGVPNVLLCFVWRYFFDWRQAMEGVEVMWSGYTFVLGFLIVFRNNQAYSRFWEGATLVQQVRGEWFNAVSSLVAFSNQDEGMRPEVEEFQHLLVRLVSMLYCAALEQVCMLQENTLEIISPEGIAEDSLFFLANCPDRCEILLQWIQRLIVNGDNRGVIKIAPPILSRAYQELSRGIVNLNNVRKIREIPFPFPYAQMITTMLLVHWILTPILASQFVESMYWAALMCFCVTGSFWSLLYIAIEIDQPFGEDENDLDMKRMLSDMNESLLFLLEPLAQVPPRFEFSPESKFPKVTNIEDCLPGMTLRCRQTVCFEKKSNSYLKRSATGDTEDSNFTVKSYKDNKSQAETTQGTVSPSRRSNSNVSSLTSQDDVQIANNPTTLGWPVGWTGWNSAPPSARSSNSKISANAGSSGPSPRGCSSPAEPKLTIEVSPKIALISSKVECANGADSDAAYAAYDDSMETMASPKRGGAGTSRAGVDFTEENCTTFVASEHEILSPKHDEDRLRWCSEVPTGMELEEQVPTERVGELEDSHELASSSLTTARGITRQRSGTPRFATGCSDTDSKLIITKLTKPALEYSQPPSRGDCDDGYLEEAAPSTSSSLGGSSGSRSFQRGNGENRDSGTCNGHSGHCGQANGFSVFEQPLSRDLVAETSKVDKPPAVTLGDVPVAFEESSGSRLGIQRTLAPPRPLLQPPHGGVTEGLEVNERRPCQNRKPNKVPCSDRAARLHVERAS